jgi:ligand-binding SRPBCC domain-containing protein
MKVSRSTIIDLPAEVVWSEVQTARLLVHIAWPVVRFIPVGSEPLDQFKPGGRYEAKLRLLGIFPFGTQWIVTSVHLPESGEWPKRLRDNGYSALIKKWDHWITISPDGEGGTRYSDDVEISAGIMTPFIWAFAQVFYWHRQRRWRGLARTLQARNVIAEEMEVFAQAKASGDTASAWRALERAHIVSQPYLGPHLASHWSMFRFAINERDTGEVAGQIFRLALAPLGAISGRIPTGNTGRANVSAFQPMDIPPDLRARLRGKPE